MESMFWISVLLLVYTYVGYPVVLFCLSASSQLFRDARYLMYRNDRRPDRSKALPTVAVVIAAYNEESCIRQRIDNLLQQEYPAGQIVIYIGSDGSTDRTNELLAEFDNPAVKSFIFPQNRGKSSVLNDLMSECAEDIVVFSDANTSFEPGTVKSLVRHFSDPRTGGVCGELHLVDPDTGRNRDGLYWRYEQMLKFHEARLGALLGANGAVYAIRRELFEPLPPDTIVDDFQNAMNVVKQGNRLRYDPEARATETTAVDLNAEEIRRIRIGAGNFQAFSRLYWALDPRRGWLCFSYISHKVLRWFAPHLMIVALVANLLLLEHMTYCVLFALQLGGYLLAAYGAMRMRDGRPTGSVTSVVSFFVSMNIALFRGFIRFLRADLGGAWQRTAR